MNKTATVEARGVKITLETDQVETPTIINIGTSETFLNTVKKDSRIISRVKAKVKSCQQLLTNKKHLCSYTTATTLDTIDLNAKNVPPTATSATTTNSARDVLLDNIKSTLPSCTIRIITRPTKVILLK